ncbi:MAG: hypothetical protein CSA54_02120 [Gammaproteobacteria bacterium]|nr:MAG: hypothetical protein CSA54_02120 [Gammaproteobacteria bacterium]
MRQVHRIDRQRRKLLKGLAALPALSGVSLLAGAPSLSRAADCGGARSLVCLFLAGGADSFRGDLAVVSNLGTLIQPTSRSDYLSSVALPQALFAHNTQQKLWQTGAGIVNGANAFGWGGAISSHAGNCNGSINVAPAFSIAGRSDFLASSDTNYISLNAGYAIERMFGHDYISDWIPVQRLQRMDGTLDSLIGAATAEGNPYLLRGIGASVRRAADATASLHSAFTNHPLDNMRYDGNNRLASQLHLVARLIAAREELGMQRQVFFVQMDGWDTHSDQLERMPALFAGLDEAVGAFQDAIDSLNAADSVTTFTASDFGRTLTSNGNGTDHGWGGHSFVFGGAVAGGQLYGELPSLAANDNPDDAGEDDGSFAGRIIPQLSVTQYAATLARWMGMDEAAIDTALPDLANFTERDIGFMAS